MVKQKFDPMLNRTRSLIALPDGEIPSTTQCISICIPAGEAYKRQLFGALYEMTHWNNYERDATHKAALVANAWRSAIMQGMINCNQFKVINGKLAFSNDGGATWTPVPEEFQAPDPGHDPRNDEPLLPPRTGSNIPCLSSANATACFVELHRELSNWYSQIGFILDLYHTIGASLMRFFPQSWSIFGLSVDQAAIAIHVLDHTASLNIEAFTTEIQDRLTCILYCNADNNGQWNAMEFEAVLSAIGTESGDMWRLIEVYLGEVAGRAGTSNAGTTTSIATHDCASCYCNECPPSIPLEESHVLDLHWDNSPLTVDGVTGTITGTYQNMYPSGYATLAVSDFVRVTFTAPACVTGISQKFARFSGAAGIQLTIHDTLGNNHVFSDPLTGDPTDGTLGGWHVVGTVPDVIEAEWMEIVPTDAAILANGIRVLFAPKI